MREPWIQAAHNVQPYGLARSLQVIAVLQEGFERVWEPSVPRNLTREHRRPSHYGHRLAVEMHNLPDDLRVRGKPIAPQSFAQHYHLIGRGTVFRLRQPPHQRLFQIEKRKE